MGARLRSWWKNIKQHLLTLLVIAIILVFAITLIFEEVKVYGTGFKGKTLWDWLQLLIIPVVLAIGGYLFTYTISRNERKTTDRHNQTEREIAQDNQREAALQDYIDKMSEFLLHEKLYESVELDEIVTVARVRTLTVLPRLDARRKKSLLEFLYGARLIFINKHIIDLMSADLSCADLNNSVLPSIDLSGANLVGAMMGFSNLNSASLYASNLYKANLFGAVLRGADLRGANLSRANLSRADLRLADLSKTNIEQGLLSDFNMRLDDVRSLADEGLGDSETDLSDADLSGANLQGAKVTDEQLAKAKSLKGATMPDGSKHP